MNARSVSSPYEKTEESAVHSGKCCFITVPRSMCDAWNHNSLASCLDKVLSSQLSPTSILRSPSPITRKKAISDKRKAHIIAQRASLFSNTTQDTTSPLLLLSGCGSGPCVRMDRLICTSCRGLVIVSSQVHIQIEVSVCIRAHQPCLERSIPFSTRP